MNKMVAECVACIICVCVCSLPNAVVQCRRILIAWNWCSRFVWDRWQAHPIAISKTVTPLFWVQLPIADILNV